MANIVLVGKSAAGKSTMEKYLVDNFKYEKSVSCTTRPIREGEVDGVDYYFVDSNKFDNYIKNNLLIEHTEYRGWKYGTLKSEISKGDNMIFVLNPNGLEQMKKLDIEFISFYIELDESERLIRQLERGDTPAEVMRRYQTDGVDFVDIENRVDFVVNNDTEIVECIDEILYKVVYYYEPMTIEEFMDKRYGELGRINGELGEY